MKIMFYALRPFDEQAYCEPYSKQYGIDYAYTAAVPTPDNLELAKGCDAVSTNPCLIAPEYLEAWAAMGVKFLPCRSIGYDHIPQQKAKELGMRISHSWYPPAGVADYAIMLMLMCNRKVGQILRRADAQDYSLSGKMGRDITRMTVGVIGTGNIGRTVLRHLSGFGCKLLAYDLYPNDEARQYAEYVDLDTLYKSCDIITLHTNATAANRHMIDANAIAKMKNGVVLINTARGTLIDPEALINGLESGKIGAAGLDVVENENGLFYFNHMGDALQNRELAMLRSFPNVIFTPHTAFYTDVNVASMVESAFKAVRAMADGEQTPLEVRLWTEPGRAESAAALAQCPRLMAGEPFDFVCAGCGDCCRNRRDLVLSGYDLYRIARRLGLPPRLTADAFCKQEFAPQTLLPAVVLRPNARTGNCPFFEADACTIHAARPLACALYPLGQAIDPATAAMEYYVQLPLCGARVSAQEQRTLQNYLDDAAITARAGIDARWAVVCTQLSDKLQQAGGRENPRYLPAARRIARALYFDYSIQDDFYPQFNANTQALWPLLDKML